MERSSLVPGFDDGAVFRSLFAAYPDSLLLVDLQGQIALANPAAVDLLGYTADELVGLSVDALVPDAIRPRHAAYRNAYADHPRARPMGMQMDLVAKRRDGSEVMVEIALSPLQSHGLPYVVAAIRSVGTYPRVKQAMQRARYAEHLAQFGRFAVDARDPKELLELVPAIAAEALQVETAEILLLEPSGLEFRVAAVTGPLQDLAVGDRIPNAPSSPSGSVIADGKALLVNDYAQQQRFQLSPRAIEHGLASELAVPLSDRGRTIGTLAVRSRTPKRFGDDELRFLDSLSSLLGTVLQRATSEEALNHAQRLETVGQLTGGVAHDFNNLLTIISGNLQVLEDAPAYAADPLIQQLVGAAARATRRGAELTSKLLAFSRRQVLQPTIVDTAALLHSLTDMLRRTLDQRVVITLDAEDALCLADPGQLESALLNVAINARDAMPLGGTLAFTCRLARSLPVNLDAEREPAEAHGYVAISISDTGDGMPEAVKERAFEPFFTTKETGRGTGLGLSTVYGFARQSRGAVSLDSAPGAGTTVTLYLPRAEGDGVDDEAFDAAAPGSVPAGLRVLLVEDDAEVRSVVQRFLASMACEVVACADAEEALRVLASESDIGLLLTDILLGAGMRGTELADAARTRRPGLPVLLMSGYSSELLDEPQGRELLRKPYTRIELERAMARVLNAAA
ncbi:PAS domain S-box protein [Variovorax sp. J22G21]|uniref:GAF domain-containing protein n=1 Tax=Variovorax fucosicus TaxID=3053517 RepID=UPI002577E3DC|nr:MULTISPECIES: GAF domain-containing protein [unclassified Variovorax]MDM0037530.1 PAS domain S-box protein [Variovorax sp. J22R193]MDM0062306.1 PAS domain S-box protein [Variovorax sp. J22G21]